MLLSEDQVLELRKRWVFDLIAGASTPPTFLSVYNKRYGRQFFEDPDLEAIARRARKRWGAAIGGGVSEAYLEVIHTSDGGGFAAQPDNERLVLYSDYPAEDLEVTLYGVTHDSVPPAVCREVVRVQGVTHVQTVKADWGALLAAVNALTPDDVVSAAAPQGTITIATAGGQAVTTLDPWNRQRGWRTAGRLVAGLPITAIVGTVIPEVGLKVYDDDLTVQANASTVALVGFVGISPDGSDLLDAKALSGTTRVSPNVAFVRLDAVLTGAVPADMQVTLLARDVGPYEAEEVLFAGIQVMCFEAYLGSDEYTAALEDKADSVRRAWETRIEASLKKLNPQGYRGGFAEVRR